MKFFNVKQIGFKYAIKGVLLGFSQFNFLLHSIVALFVIIASFIVNISTIEWVVILFCIGGVLSLELINSAIEKMVDQVSPNYSLFAQKTKDLSAGAVLIASITSFIIGLIIFLPKFIVS